MEMGAITITLPQERMVKLKELADSLGITLEALVQLSVEDLLTRSDNDFEKAANRVLEKNAELYRRLA
jgi:hypothetical protein